MCVEPLQEDGGGSQWVCGAPDGRTVLAGGDVRCWSLGWVLRDLRHLEKLSSESKEFRIEINRMVNLKFGQCKIKPFSVGKACFGRWSVRVHEYLESTRAESFTYYT